MMEQIGTVTRLQVQILSLKLGERPHRRFDPTPITQVPLLSLVDGGVRGYTDDGVMLADVHHPDFGTGKNRGNNGISIGFSAHYQKMRDRFGACITDGIAGENILVETERVMTITDLARDVFIETDDGDFLRLEQIIVATPCVEFTRYALGFPESTRADRTVTDALQFLDNGMRGYYATYEGPCCFLRCGDRVFLG